MGKVTDLGKHYSEQLTRFVRMDSIRVLKLLEMCQFIIMGVFMGVFASEFIHKRLAITFVKSNYVTEEYPSENNNNNPILYLHIVYDLILVAVSTYYLRKLSQLVPFIFSFVNREYVPNKKGEGMTGLIVGLGFVYSRGLSNLMQRLDLLLGKPE